MRERILIATKCGIRFVGEPNPDSPHRYDFSAEHILGPPSSRSAGSASRRSTFTNSTAPIRSWTRREWPGRSTSSSGRQGPRVRRQQLPALHVAALQTACPMPLVVNQVEIHLGGLHCLYDGTLDQCLAQRLTPLVWSPLGGGFLGDGGTPPEKADPARREGLAKLLTLMDQTAAKYGITRTVIALAWLLKHPAKIIPIVGSLNPAHIVDATKADAVDLDREDWYRLLVAARMQPLP